MPRNRTEIKGLSVEWLGHSTVGIYGNKITYIDPFSEILQEGDKKADLIICTHAHRDHFDALAINKLAEENTHVVVKSGCETTNLLSKSVKELQINESFKINGTEINGVPAYNIIRFKSPGQPFHPKGFGMGVIAVIDGVKFYYAGDTDYIPEMNDLAAEKIEVAFLPIGGKFTMDQEEAVKASAAIKAKIIIPVHYNHLKGTEADPVSFKEKVEKISSSEVIVL